MATHHSSEHSCHQKFKKGDAIEVLRNADDGDVPVWFPATVIDPPSPDGTLHVKFKTLYIEIDCTNGGRKRKKIRDYVTDGVTRPVPQAEPHHCFVVGEEVEAFYEEGWWKGVIDDVLENSMYRVVIGGVVAVSVDKSRVRVCHDRSSFPSTCQPQQEKSYKLIFQSIKGTKLRIIRNQRASTPESFPKGTPVEVKSYEEGYQGSWYTAMVVGPAGEEDKILVQYDTLTTDDEMEPLEEMAHPSNIRPLPPILHRMDCFEILEEVDAWYNDGWWVGLVSKVLSGSRYAVYFWTTNEEFEFEHSQIRTHHDFINEKWVAAFLRLKACKKASLERIKLQTGGRTSMAGLLRGLKVEIAHGEKGFLTTWYPAVILGPVKNRKYLVEYRTLKTRDGRELIKEEVDVLSIRPCPPVIQRPVQFQRNDRVDAWDFNGWQVGQIDKSLKEFNYAVYFWATNTLVEYAHDCLRTHQDFINGVWLRSTKDCV